MPKWMDWWFMCLIGFAMTFLRLSGDEEINNQIMIRKFCYGGKGHSRSTQMDYHLMYTKLTIKEIIWTSQRIII
jgi:hypothetical protein